MKKITLGLAGLDGKVEIKNGAKMLRRNIDVTLELVSETVCAIIHFLQDANGAVKIIDAQFNK